jgi:signal peptidase II
MYPSQSIKITNFLYLTHVQNKGAAFGLFTNMQYFLLVVGILMVALILYFHFALKRDDVIQIPLSLILAGSLGNFTDRIIFGRVTDYLDFRFWPVFNLADTLINVGIFWILLTLILPRTKRKPSHFS